MVSLSPAARLALRQRLTLLARRVSRLERRERPASGGGGVTALDAWLLLDASSTMLGSFAGTTRLDAAFAAITAANQWLDTQLASPTRAKLGYHYGSGPLGGGLYESVAEAFMPPAVAPDIESQMAFELEFVVADGETPLAHGLRRLVESEADFGAANAPRLVVIAGGVPTLDYQSATAPVPTFGEGYLYDRADVEAVVISNGMGGWRSIAEVEAEVGGPPLAHAMQAAQDALAELPALQIWIVCVGSDFNPELYEYLAAISGGTCTVVTTQDALNAALLAAVGG